MKDFRLRTSTNRKEITVTDKQATEPRILKIGTCTSLSGRTTLTYHVGYRDDVCFRIWATSGKGVFSKEWVCASDIQKLLKEHESLTAPLMLPLFTVGRSVNSAGFLLAVLKNEGLVSLSEEHPHQYVRADPAAFVEAMSALIKSGVSLDAAQSPVIAKTRRRGRVAAWPSSDEAQGG
jgi:hypothetical protein